MKSKIALILIVSCFVLFINLNLEKEYLDKIQLISKGSFENLSVTVLLSGNNNYENQVMKLLNSIQFVKDYDLTSHKENLIYVTTINIDNLKSYDQYESLKDLFTRYEGKYYNYVKLSGTYKMEIPNDSYLKIKHSIMQYLKSKSVKVFEFENDNMIYINNDWIVPNIENFNIAICKYDSGTYLYIGLPEIMMNY
ncbi:MAG: hypothetical protein FWC47_02335 [Oscillospiraceae bacterium]|nr:hypothetical protein [Oscillospiraceae bacterium]